MFLWDTKVCKVYMSACNRQIRHHQWHATAIVTDASKEQMPITK